MTTPTPLPGLIATAAEAPASESADGQSVTERPLTELIEADKHTAGKSALSRRGFGMQVRKIRNGSALG